MCSEASRQATHEVVTDPTESAKAAGLRYVYDHRPGIARKRWRNGFRYLAPDGKTVRDPEILARIKSLVIPPAWVDVWICTLPNGHLQATGRDARGRKQSRYHPRWREVRDEVKYERMLLFGKALPKIRKQVEHDLAQPGLPREKVLATIVRLMETTFIRVGNTEYARTNHSYGLTTMHRRHVAIQGATITFSFQGKSGVQHTIDVNDRRIARIVRTCSDTPGYELFEYLDSDGTAHKVDSADVNEYLCAMTDEHFTAKDFRTWAGTVLACSTLREFEAFTSETQAKKNMVQAIASVAAHLGNTPSVCRKCYVHPALLECYTSGTMAEKLEQLVGKKASRSRYALQPEECAVMHLLQLEPLTRR
ncbi:MAG: DNA topoisomerase IB [Granulicella sp.]